MAYTFNWGRPTETSEPYLMMAYISWFIALGIEASYLAYTFNWGRPTETSEPYLMMAYISWFTALGKNVQFLHLGQFLSNYRELRLHTWHMLTSVEDQQKAVNHILCSPIFHGSLHLERSVHLLCLGQFISNYKG